MKKLIGKYQSGIRIPVNPDTIAYLLQQMSPVDRRSETVLNTTRVNKERADNQKRTSSTKEALRRDNKKPSSQKIGTRVTVASRTNPEDVRVTRLVGQVNSPQITERVENPERRVSDELLRAYYNNKELEKRFNEEVVPAAGEFMNMFMPSTWVGAVADKNRSLIGSLIEGNKGLGELAEGGEDANLMFDMASPFIWSKGTQLGSKALNSPIGRYLTTVRLPKTRADYLRLGPLEFKLPQGRLNIGLQIPEDIRIAAGIDPVTGEPLFRSSRVRNRPSRPVLNELLPPPPEEINIDVPEASVSGNIPRDYLENVRNNYIGYLRLSGYTDSDIINLENEYTRNLGFNTPEELYRSIIREVSDPYDYLKVRSYLGNSEKPLHTRSKAEVKQLGRYTPDEVINPNTGRLRPNVDFDQVYTGSHGWFIYPDTPVENVVTRLSRLRNNPDIGVSEVREVMRDNPSGRSGIIVHTHNGDVSVDSFKLANLIQQRLGEKAVRLPVIDEYVNLNGLGYNTLFSDKIFEEAAFKKALENSLYHPNNLDNYNFIRFSDGSIVVKNTRGETVGVYPALDEKEVLGEINKSIERLNDKFKLDYKPAKFTTDPDTPPMWTFRKGILVPNQHHVTLKNGGIIKKRLVKKP